MFDQLAGSWYFSSMDMLWAYWSIPLRETDRHKTAFTLRNKKYCWRVVCFGLTNAPATFSHLVNKVFQGYNNDFALCFLDDVLAHSGKEFSTHLLNLEKIFKRMIAANLKFKLPKCLFGASQVPWLGHIITREGIKPDPKKIEAVKGMRRPASKKQVRQFLGLASYYRQFVEGFSEIAKPLYQLTKDTPKGVEWTDDCEWSWQTLKDKLVSTPILIYPRFDRPFIVETDASGQGLGAVLSQETDHGRKPVAYASRVCSSTEANYSASELECLGVIYAV
ncbi:unnamed protein product [Heterosigma akashiwo]